MSTFQGSLINHQKTELFFIQLWAYQETAQLIASSNSVSQNYITITERTRRKASVNFSGKRILYFPISSNLNNSQYFPIYIPRAPYSQATKKAMQSRAGTHWALAATNKKAKHLTYHGEVYNNIFLILN